jgi:putative oxidoreductase
MPDLQTFDIAMLVLRTGLGLVVIGHAVQKLFGWLGGHGLAGTAASFDALGFRPGKLNVLAAGASELVGAILLILGLFTPLASAALIGTMVVASSVTFSHGFFAWKGGYELTVAYGFCAAVVALGGPGKLSIDELLGLPVAGLWPGVGAIVLGIVAAIPVLVRARVLVRASA